MTAEATIVHELAGLLSGVWSFSEIVASRPDHPDRESFIGILRDESKRAAQAMKDLQLLRSIEAGRPGDAPGPVWLGELLAGAAKHSDHPELFTELASAFHDDAPAVLADPGPLSEILVRVIDVGAELAGDAEAELSVEQERDSVTIAIACPGLRRGEVEAGLVRGEGKLRVLYLARRLFGFWGGSISIEERVDHVTALLTLVQRNASTEKLEAAG